MEVGKWIVFAFLAGAVLVGFRTRTLKWYEFAVSGLFLILLDGLVFNGQIAAWVGQLGSNVKSAADGATAGFAVLAGPTALARLARLGRRMWAHRPAPLDYAGLVAATVIARIWLDLPVPIGFAVLSAALAGMVLIAALTDPDIRRDPDGPAEQDGRGDRGGEVVASDG
jgi:hypothetical protein